MKPVEIGKAYDQITHIWESDDFDLANGIEQHKKAIGFVKNKGKALDIGCGCTGRFIDLLINEGFRPTGLDVSEKMLTLAGNRHPDIEFIHADICRYQFSEHYDFVTAWDSIWHVPLEEQKNVITKVIDCLNPGGVFIFSFGGIADPGAHSNNFMGPEIYYSSLGTEEFLKLFIELGCAIKHLEYDQYPELHAYLIVEKS
ncbi:MAG: hypothetical protein PWR01_4341 [Clostridiales bacterium]|nr:hypothetical protein [Clostridiales bacterium]MDN5283268.1 hypothetical protein [Candidatus Ozemobacter sp.]